MPDPELVSVLPGLRAPCLFAVSCPQWLRCSCELQICTSQVPEPGAGRPAQSPRVQVEPPLPAWRFPGALTGASLHFKNQTGMYYNFSLYKLSLIIFFEKFQTYIQKIDYNELFMLILLRVLIVIKILPYFILLKSVYSLLKYLKEILDVMAFYP